MLFSMGWYDRPYHSKLDEMDGMFDVGNVPTKCHAKHGVKVFGAVLEVPNLLASQVSQFETYKAISNLAQHKSNCQQSGLVSRSKSAH